MAINVWVLILASALGAAVGSFLNVVAYRLPLKLSLWWPGSRCPHCLTPLGATENIPILGWLLLHGQCKHCGEPIAPRYPLVELTTAILFGLLVATFGITPQTIAYALLVSLLVALALIDWDTLELPHELTLPGIYLGLVYQMAVLFAQNPLIGLLEGLLGYGLAVLLLDAMAVGGRVYLWFKVRTGQAVGWEPLASLGVLGLGWGIGIYGIPQAPAWAVALAFYGAILLLWDSWGILILGSSDPAAVEEDGLVALGGGDVLLGGLIGAWLGWQGLLVALAIGFLMGAVYGLAAGQTNRFAFGPFLVLGGIVSLLWGSILIDNYLRLLGIT